MSSAQSNCREDGCAGWPALGLSRRASPSRIHDKKLKNRLGVSDPNKSGHSAHYNTAKGSKLEVNIEYQDKRRLSGLKAFGEQASLTSIMNRDDVILEEDRENQNCAILTGPSDYQKRHT